MIATPEILDRMPPADVEAEKAIVGSILLDPRKTDDAATIVRPEDFHHRDAGIVYAELLATHDSGTAIDILTLKNRLQAAGRLDAVGGVAFLAECSQAAPRITSIAYYARIVAEKAQRRRLLRLGEEALRLAHDDTTAIGDAVEVVQRGADAVVSQADDVVDNHAALIEAMDFIDAASERKRIVATGIDKFDSTYGGMIAGEMIVIAARTGEGKTALALRIAETVSQRNGAVLFASLEMKSRELAVRRLCSESGVNSELIWKGELSDGDRHAIIEASTRLQSADLFTFAKPGLSIADLRREARRLRNRHGLSLIVADYIQLMRGVNPKLRRYEQIGEISGGLKGLAMELDIPVLCLAQLNREADKGEQPRLSHLRESGSIEQDADTVLLIHHRDDDKAEIIVAKVRRGGKGVFALTWRDGQFFNIESQYEEFEQWNK